MATTRAAALTHLRRTHPPPASPPGPSSSQIKAGEDSVSGLGLQRHRAAGSVRDWSSAADDSVSGRRHSSDMRGRCARPSSSAWSSLRPSIVEGRRLSSRYSIDV